MSEEDDWASFCRLEKWWLPHASLACNGIMPEFTINQISGLPATAGDAVRNEYDAARQAVENHRLVGTLYEGSERCRVFPRDYIWWRRRRGRPALPEGIREAWVAQNSFQREHELLEVAGTLTIILDQRSDADEQVRSVYQNKDEWSLVDAVLLDCGQAPLPFIAGSADKLSAVLEFIRSVDRYKEACRAIEAGDLAARSAPDGRDNAVRRDDYVRWRAERVEEYGPLPRFFKAIWDANKAREGFEISDRDGRRNDAYSDKHARVAQRTLFGALCIICYVPKVRSKKRTIVAQRIADKLSPLKASDESRLWRKAIWPKEAPDAVELLGNRHAAQLIRDSLCMDRKPPRVSRENRGLTVARAEFLLRTVVWCLGHDFDSYFRHGSLAIEAIQAAIGQLYEGQRKGQEFGRFPHAEEYGYLEDLGNKISDRKDALIELANS